jgi:hypothetical protein
MVVINTKLKITDILLEKEINSLGDTLSRVTQDTPFFASHQQILKFRVSLHSDWRQLVCLLNGHCCVLPVFWFLFFRNTGDLTKLPPV